MEGRNLGFVKILGFLKFVNFFIILGIKKIYKFIIISEVKKTFTSFKKLGFL
jgi:hypothetical protein